MPRQKVATIGKPGKPGKTIRRATRRSGLPAYRQRVIERLQQAIRPDTPAEEQPPLPVIGRFRPVGSTRDVPFRTSRVGHGTEKRLISYVVVDTTAWEHTIVLQLCPFRTGGVE